MTILLLARRMAALGAVLLVAACATPPVPGEAEIPEDARVTHRAVWIGESNHDTIGTISLYQSDQYPVVVFEQNFEFRAAPGTVVSLGRDGYRRGTSLGTLLRNQGGQAYAVPENIDISYYNEVWLWDPAGDKPLGLARLTPLL
ncbi:MAG: DM13 domain-containing protein [Pseudomonadota bacterium]